MVGEATLHIGAMSDSALLEAICALADQLKALGRLTDVHAQRVERAARTARDAAKSDRLAA